jgi:hypothetical protein
MGAEELLSIQQKAAAFLLTNNKEQATQGKPSEMTAIAAEVLRLTQTDLSAHFTLTREFLDVFTKAGIEAVLREAVNAKGERFATQYAAYRNAQESDDVALGKLLALKKGEILDIVFNPDVFDFTGFVPTCVISVLGDNKSKG